MFAGAVCSVIMSAAMEGERNFFAKATQHLARALAAQKEAKLEKVNGPCNAY